MLINQHVKTLFLSILNVPIILSILLPSLSIAKKIEVQKNNDSYRNIVIPNYLRPFDGTNEIEKNKLEEEYPENWYEEFNPEMHFDDIEMPLAKTKLNEFLIKAGERLEVSVKYRSLVTEVFVRSTMMFRLAGNAYSRAYLKELNYIFRRLADIDTELGNLQLQIEDRKSELDRIIEGAINAGIEELTYNNHRAIPIIKEVLSTIIDFGSRDIYKSQAQNNYNSKNSFYRVSSKFLSFFIISISTLIGFSHFELANYLGVEFDNLFLSSLICSYGLSNYASNFIFPYKFKCKQKYIFNQTVQTCSDILGDNK
ncbi:MAG: hypothetical protein H6625_01595 [Bdellovibrionaceae bacterium]|nr:hypothetical protein [Pseudobdellovibrionaceae bacterium]